MSFESFLFALKNAVKNIIRNYFLTIASLVVLGICLIALGSTVLVVKDVDAIVDSVGSENRIVIFLDENLSQPDINRVGRELAEIKNITDITYESPEQALQNYASQLGSDAVTGLDASVFRPSYIFDIIDLTKYDQTVYAIQKIEGLGKFESGQNIGQPAIRSSKTVIDKIVQIKQVMSFFSVVVVVIFLVLAVFIIMNSVKLSVFARRTEINIMKYVGATDFYIQLPYFVEGMLTGILSGVVAFAVQRLIYNSFIQPVLGDLINGVTMYDFDANGLKILGLFVLFGGVVGIIGSVFPVKKYLNV